MKIIFFEIDAINVKRYYKDVLPDVFNNAKVTILIEGKDEAQNLKKLDFELPIHVLSNMSNNQLEKLIMNSDALIINGQRVPDIMLTLLANKLGTKVLYLQHGMYIPYMKRGTSFFLKRIYKSIRYLKYAVRGALVDQNRKLFLDLLNSHLVNGLRNYNFNKFNGFPDRSLVFSEYWKIWHIDYYFSNSYSKFSIVGNPEPTRFKKVPYEGKFVTYCYQTLIEDGRIDKKYLIKKIKDIIEWSKLNKRELIVKTHPRMSAEMKKFFIDRNIKLTTNSLPITEVVIGHYSSLMPLWAYYGCKVFSLELEGHYGNLDASIEETSILIKNLDQILYFLENPGVFDIDIPKNVELFFNYNQEYSTRVWKELREISTYNSVTTQKVLLNTE